MSIVLAKNDAAARLSIRDTGSGIVKQDLPHIFDRYYRAKNDVQCAVKGTGLGLAICKTIVEKHGGTIGVESEPGRGTTFFISLPLAMPVIPIEAGIHSAA